MMAQTLYCVSNLNPVDHLHNGFYNYYDVKVMFLSTIARPCLDDEEVCVFDGNIGIFLFVEHVAAQCASVNRPKGTTKVKTPVNRVFPS